MKWALQLDLPSTEIDLALGPGTLQYFFLRFENCWQFPFST